MTVFRCSNYSLFLSFNEQGRKKGGGSGTLLAKSAMSTFPCENIGQRQQGMVLHIMLSLAYQINNDFSYKLYLLGGMY